MADAVQVEPTPNPNAVTAGAPAVSNILDISINNAFGRLWPANAPQGLDHEGSETILDPGGMPLAGAPNARSGGVFLGGLTNRQPVQVIAGHAYQLVLSLSVDARMETDGEIQGLSEASFQNTFAGTA